jgi:predicted negative regulator of RcsB-dependent stress response
MPDMKNWILENLDGVILWVVIIVAGSVAWTCLSISEARREAMTRSQLYPAWSKVHPQVELTYDEWHVLYRKNLLPK